MTEFLNSQASTGHIIFAIATTAFIVMFLLFAKKLGEMGKNIIKNSYLKRNRLEEHSTIFYRGGYYVVMKCLDKEKSYSIMDIESKNICKLNAEVLISESISQEKLLGALAKADSFTEFYNGEEHLLKKYLKDI